jgi:non-ribosomal peptide synthetase-like protein
MPKALEEDRRVESDGRPTPAASSSAHPLLIARFDRWALQTPDAIAIELPASAADGSASPVRTYAGLARAARAIADAIADRVGPAASAASSTRPEVIVAIRLGRSDPDLYAAQLAVMSLGAAFTCVDPSFPPEHVRAILEDAGVPVVLTDTAGAEWLASHGLASGAREAVDVGRIVAAGATEATPARLRPPPAWLTGERLAYLIYTSGTTGRPKGVEIEHASIANLVASDVERFQLGPQDRVAQCSSPAYDSSIEEAWLAFAAGATLVPLDDETVRLGPDLVPILQRERITVLCPPPTLLRTTGCVEPEKDLPSLRLLYVGGEALPQDLADRWGRNRWLENGYGPTECTVTVMRTRIEPGVPVSIGHPVPGHTAHILDGDLRPVADGAFGELCIAGIGLARGYRNAPAQTAERFVLHPEFGRIYRTGDLVRRREDGCCEYHGRIDAQVKIRGYRVELGAIEAVLASVPGVREAACCVQEDEGVQTLVAHCVLAEGSGGFDPEHLRQVCRERLPAYMVPARLAPIAALPTTVGGKLDRKRLPRIERAIADGERSRAIRAPRHASDALVLHAFATTLRRTAPISIDDDFFVDLGGDSLSVVGVLCELRKDHRLAGLTARDIYGGRTAAAIGDRIAAAIGNRIAERLDGQVGPPEARCEADASPRTSADRIASPAPVTVARSFVTALIQGAFLLGSVTISAWIWYAVGFLLGPWALETFGPVLVAMLAPPAAALAILAFAPVAVLLTALAHRLLVGRTRPGQIPVWSGAYVRCWIVEQCARLIPWSTLEGTIFVGTALRTLGATVGKRVHVHRGVQLGRGGWDLLSIGDDVTLRQEASLQVIDYANRSMVLAPITIGDGATIGVRAGVGGGATVGAGALVEALSFVRPGTHVPANGRWDGVPAGAAGERPATPTPRDRGIDPLLHGVLTLGLRVAHAAWLGVPVAAALLLIEWLGGREGAELVAWLYAGDLSLVGLVVIILTSFVCVPIGLLTQACMVRCMGRVQPGTVSRWGFDALRIHAKSAAVDAAGRWLSGTLYWPIWLRIAGMRIGRGCEISTIIDVVPESVTIGNECFFADGIYFCSPVVDRGTITVGATSLGSGTFLGNHAVVPAGGRYPDGMFIGVATVADAARARPSSGWFGHPPMELPRRDVVEADRRLTHEPGAMRFLSRLSWETLRFALPVIPTVVVLLWFGAVGRSAAEASTASGAGMVAFLCVTLPVLTLAALTSLCLVILLMKWALLGRVRPGHHALWSCWCSRWDFLFVAWGMYAKALLERLEGTVFLTWFLRAIGMRIGRNVVLGDGFAQVVDPDMLTFEDGATVSCNFQAHTFEDRILKIDHLVIRAGATVGHHAVIFYGADIGERTIVEPHSVVMKRESLRAEGRYAGCPTELVGSAE